MRNFVEKLEVSVSKVTKAATGRISIIDALAGCSSTILGRESRKEMLLGRVFKVLWSCCTAKFISPMQSSILDDFLIVLIMVASSFRTSEEQIQLLRLSME
ncbi:hypothetical protein Droror1_Dr00027482 [Drosera rotundifolia]